MSLLSIVPRHAASAGRAELERVEVLARTLLRQFPDLALRAELRALAPERVEDAPTFHVDDFGAIFLPADARNVLHYQDRARLRAGDGDLVASASPQVPGFEAYCRERLGLGDVTWLRPARLGAADSLAADCWNDREVRRVLVRAARDAALLQVHPHMGCPAVWALALLLQRSSRRPVKVLAPPPALALRVNDKLWFADVAERLLGAHLVLRTSSAANLAILAHRVRELAPSCKSLVVKRPDSAGGRGNVVLEAAPFRRAPLAEVRLRLRGRLESIGWDGEIPLQLGAWHEPVRASLSSQLWIPPEAEGVPLIEGLCEQVLEGPEAAFLGSRSAASGTRHAELLTSRSFLLALLFQRLGYVGRCSFDTITVGSDAETAELRFVECNGRWGGASVPMTLANRLVGSGTPPTHETTELRVPGLERTTFRDLVRGLDELLLDAGPGRGSRGHAAPRAVVLYNPGGLAALGAIHVLALHPDPAAATRLLHEVVPARLSALAGRSRPRRDQAARTVISIPGSTAKSPPSGSSSQGSSESGSEAITTAR